ncbi:MAG TPA: DICT sensory domain-containing protein [Chloroflexia bacterium]|jgi:DICT domain-containing protein|nr:DICT sensory domain-containing protein [Chloroflexia bacterium]
MDDVHDLIDRQTATWPDTAFREFTLDEARTLAGAPLTFTTSVLGMEAISHVIEDHAAALGRPVEVFACFQKLSNALAQRARYEAILAAGSQVYFYGEPDWPAWDHPNLRVVPIRPGHPLADVWLVALCDPRHVSMALLARELPDGAGRIRRQGDLIDRRFQGFKTYDGKLVSEMVEGLKLYAGAAHR